MEIMTSNSSSNAHNSQKELRLLTPLATASSLDASISTSALTSATHGARSPFQREVREWQRIDPDTGALLTGRLEADRWINGPLNSYGKISDSQNISQPNGTQQTQRKQLEVIQTCTAGGAAMQVIRSQTVQTTSSRWSTPSSSATASPSPTSLLQQSYNQTVRETSSPSISTITTTVTNNEGTGTRKDKYLKTTQKRTSTTKASKSITPSSNTASCTISSPHRSPLSATNGLDHQQHHPTTRNYTSHTNRGIAARSNRSSTHTINHLYSNKSKKETNTSPSSSTQTASHNLVNGHNKGKRNWPQIVTENMSSSTLDICDNDHDNEHVHDNDYIVEEQLSDGHDDNDDDVGNGNHHPPDNVNDTPSAVAHHRPSYYRLHKVSTPTHEGVDDKAVEDDDDDANGDYYNDDDDDISNHGDDGDNECYFSNKSAGVSHKQTTLASLGAPTNNADFDDLSQHPQLHDHHHELRRNGHCSSSNSSLNSHSGSNSCSNNTSSNQLFLLDTAPSLKLSNLMKSSSSISNSSNNSTTAVTNINPSMNTHHKSMASKKLSLHAIAGSDHATTTTGKTTATASSTPSPTPSPTTTTARPSWQQPTLFRQNSNTSNTSNNRHSPIPNSSQSNKLKHTQANSSSSSSPSHSHLTKSRVGDNNCCGSSSDESRSYADLRHHHHHHHHHLSQQQRQHSPAFQLNERLTPTQSSPLRQQQYQYHQQPHQHQHQPLYNRVDLESFRHYNNSNNISDTYIGTDAATDATAAANDDGLRLSSRHLRRQQIPRESYSPITTLTSLQRSRSISTDDLSTEWDINGSENTEPAEWRRVSKLRRSFQSTTTKQPQPSPTSARRPLDLPACSVSVSKIRAELENGRRLNTVMKNNHVDLAALSSILNGPDSSKASPKLERSSFLTAESLKEIRGKLKKLSDESLYKEDFVINQQSASRELPEQDQIEVQAPTIRRSLDRSPDRYSAATVKKDLGSPVVEAKHTTNSLESRLKYKETNPIEWHLRRKSYGFEKMSPPDKSTMQRMDASTDSGLGRSGELQNWSPTQAAANDSSRSGAVVVRFGERLNSSTASTTTTTSSAMQRRYRTQKSYDESENSQEEDGGLNKRHSIAVDESKYVSDNGRQTTHVRLNGFPDSNSLGGATEGKFLLTTEISNSSSAFSQRGQQKRVEFCKTEVHFATESGRVNIVETDSKPPPTNNFRRRRSRSSSVGPLQSLVKSATTVSTTASTSSTVAMPVTLFGDDKLRRKTIASSTVAYRAPLMESPDQSKDSMKNVTVTIPESFGLTESSRSSYASTTSGVDTTDYETDEMTSLRGILKNKPAKPKPYVLGENIEKPDDLWGVHLKPVQGKSDLVGRVQNDSPTTANTTAAASLAQLTSVAERIRQVEQQQDFSQSNGFSTKINLNLGRTSPHKNWEETDLPTSNVMSIKLHSPQAAGEATAPLKMTPPIAKPRTVTNIQDSEPPRLHSTSKQPPPPPFQTSLPTKDSLKIIKEARGARQLREHELSYFGIAASKAEHDNKLKTKLSTNSSNTRNSPKRSLPLRRLSEETSALASKEDEQKPMRRNWQLEHDKPDLLNHSHIHGEKKRLSQLKPAERMSLKNKAELDEDEEHLYENIANEITPIFKVKDVYDRKMDLQRDEMILSEMNESADQTLRELSDEAALKDRKRRSLQRRNSKPLETIDEKAIAEKITDTCIAVKVSRSTFASEAKKTSRHSTPSPTRLKSRERTSSQSSVECCPRARSRSLSSEKEYEQAKAPHKPSRSGQVNRHKSHKSQVESRSSSLDSQRSYHSQYSSGEEQQQSQQQQIRSSFRREDRSRAKTKRSTASNNVSFSSSSAHRQEKTSKSSAPSESKRSSSTTRSSAHRERVECSKDNATGHTDSRDSLSQNCHKQQQQQQHHHQSTLQRSTPVTSSGRRSKDELRDSQRMKRSAVVATEKATAETYETPESTSAKNAVSRSSREEQRNNSTRSSSHRQERSDKDKEKLSKSKGHSSRSTSQQHHHERSNSSTKNPHHNGPEKHISSKTSKTKSSTAPTADNNTTHSKNAQQQQPHHHPHQSSSKERSKHERHQRSTKREETPSKAQEHVHGLKSAIIKTTTKLREKSRARKEKK
ncbi:serine-rich adhesin for platelets isoform X3 [Stomoxys calcitrans]|uniref:serine-rich adhesin for platelets isoform X3 n=1 Tax=Stomoxys calcitrans TaxID=35570 RepID=UPI0027E351F7|nr:serine-rich adhesin for platelets isoform X3 [Stomoxys calcitrans]